MNTLTNALLDVWNHLSGLHWVINREFELVAISNAYLEWMEESRNALIGKNIFSIYQNKNHTDLPGDFNQLREQLEKLRDAGDQKLQLSGQGPENKVFALLYIPVLDTEGQLAFVIHEAKELPQEKDAQNKPSALEQRLKEFEVVLSTVEDGIFIIDREYRFMYCNQKNLSFLGKKRMEEVLGKHMYDLEIPSELVDPVHHTYEMVIKRKKPSTHTTTFVIPGGRRVFFEYLLVPILSADGEVEYIAGSTRDISERNMAEEALRRSEKELAAIFSKAAVGLTEISLEGNILKLNHEICHILGRSKEELLEMNITEITHPDDVSRTFAALEHLLNTNNPVSIDKRYVKADGSIVWANSSITRLDDEQGHPRSVLAVTVDLTERIEVEQALRKSERQLEFEIKSLNELHKMTMEILEAESLQEALDKMLDTTITLLHADFGNIQRYHPENQVLEMVTHQGFTEDFLEKFRFINIRENASCTRALRSGKRFVIEDMERDEDFSDIRELAQNAGYRSAQSTPLISRNGEVIGVLSTYYCKPGKLPLRNAKILDLLTRQIADLIDNREGEEALRHAKEKAETAARAKEEFLAHMSHEIRTPLNAILGLSVLLSNHNRQEELQENLQTLRFSAENLKMLVNNILDFSKIQAGKLLLDESHYNLRAFMQSLYKTHLPNAREKEIELIFEVEDTLPEMIYCDQLKLSQIMHNLLGNAIKFTEKGKVKVALNLRKQIDTTLEIDFAVSDTGIGMAQDKLVTIFDAFMQADNSTVKRYGGTGLGLSITSLLLEMMGSSIEVESKVGEGSRFFFTLSVKEGKPEVETVAEKELSATNEELQPYGIEILLTEDEAINRMLVNQFLDDWWHLEPDEATNGEEALKMASTKHYDIILMDVRMPLMDGYHATQHIRNLEDQYYQTLPIIALTADTPQEVKKHPLAHLFTDIVTKPFDPDTLRKKLLEYIPSEKKKIKPLTPSVKLSNHEVEQIFHGDSDMINEFYTKAIQGLVAYQKEYSMAMTHGDASILANANHKLTTTLKMLKLDALKALLDHSEMLLKEDAPKEKINQTRQKGEEMIGQAIFAVEQQKTNTEN